MAFNISRLRFWFGVGAISVCAIVAGAYFYAHSRIENALKEVPGKISIQVQQSAEGFTISKSEAGRTLFKIQASRAVKYKVGGRVELHNVAITVYSEDSSRFDQITGDDFVYDPQSGDVSAQGKVKIDLGASLPGPDSSSPQPENSAESIHLESSGLVFNQKTGDAHTSNRLDFQIPQAQGSAVGADYRAHTATLTLLSQVELNATGPNSARLAAQKAFIDKKQRTITFLGPQITRAGQHLIAEKAIVFLRPDNKAERMLISGDVRIESSGQGANTMRASELNLQLANDGRTLSHAVLSGDVTLSSAGKEHTQALAQRVDLNFAGHNVLKTVHAAGGVELHEEQPAQRSGEGPQRFDVSAPALDLTVGSNQHLRTALTLGPSQLKIRPAKSENGQEILVSADRFLGKFNADGKLISVHGEENARIMSRDPGQPDRISTSDTLDASLKPGGEIQSISQKGHLEYLDGMRKAWAVQGRYTPADQILTLTGAPRIEDASVAITANIVKLNRSTGEATATGDVKTTYNNLKPQPNGALLASSSPIHVTAQQMQARNSPAIAIYTGRVRLWQDANVVQAPRLQFDRDRRDITATGTASDPVSTVLVQTDASGKVMPVAITSTRLTYSNENREVKLEGGVAVKGADAVLTADRASIWLAPQTGNSSGPASLAGKVEKVVAEGAVSVRQDARTATGNQLTYTPDDGKFVMTGGPPSIFDAEHGKITGVSLTFFRRDDTVLVEGSSNSPTVTRARVAR